MYQLFRDVCDFLESVNSKYQAFSNGIIVISKGELSGMVFNINPDDCYVRVHKQFEIYFDLCNTSIDSLLSTLYKHKAIEQDYLDQLP